jgi:serine/threonine protein kinase
VSFPAPKYATEEGSLVGSPRYVSPEQVRQGAVDARTDVYGVGILLYQLLTGHDPFSHYRNVPELLHAHLVELPRAPSAVLPRQHVPYCLPELDQVILRALAKNPADRHQSAADFAYQPWHILARLPEPTSPIPGGNGTAIIPRAAPALVAGNGTTILPIPSLAGLGNSRAMAFEPPVALNDGGALAPPANDFDNEPGHTLQMWTPPSPGASSSKLFLVVMVGTAVVFAVVLLALLRVIGVLG